MKMTLFHGSEIIIGLPTYGKGKLHNDYGRGFYCTEQQDMAREWAVDLHRDGYVNAYQLEMDGLTSLNLNGESFTILHWLEVLLRNRQFEVSSPLAREAKRYLIENFHVHEEQYDVIVGYRADDSYFSFAQDFINGTISVRQLSEAMRLGKLGQQIVIKSEKAFSQLEFLNSEWVPAAQWYPQKALRDKLARKSYFSVDKNKWVRGDIYMPQILEQEMKPDDIRIR